MRSHTEKKIEEAFSLAVKLGLKDLNETEQHIFKMALKTIATAAVDDAKSNIGELLHKESQKYL